MQNWRKMIPQTRRYLYSRVIVRFKSEKKGRKAWVVGASWLVLRPLWPWQGERSRLNMYSAKKKVNRHFVRRSSALVIWSSDTFSSWNIVVMRLEVIDLLFVHPYVFFQNMGTNPSKTEFDWRRPIRITCLIGQII